MIQLLAILPMLLATAPSNITEKESYVCPCDIGSSEIQDIIDTLLQLANREGEGDAFNALQIGKEKQVILIDVSSADLSGKDSHISSFQEMINPEVLWHSEEEMPFYHHILLQYYDRAGNIITQEYKGSLALRIQQEISKLDSQPKS
jgi:peptide deformylase